MALSLSFVALLLLQLAWCDVLSRVASCKSASQPNPIAHKYGLHTTGTLNGTIMIIPIPYSDARNMIPAEYAILDDLTRELFPGYGPDAEFPMIVHAAVGHDARYNNQTVDDFSIFSASLPFVDRLGDGRTPFRYGHASMVSALSDFALNWFHQLGPPYPTPASFDPPCDAYEPGILRNHIMMRSWSAATGALTGAIHLGPTTDQVYALESIINATNQPYFANDMFCDHTVLLWNTTLSNGAALQPRPVYGAVNIAPPLYHYNTTYRTWGFAADLAFVDFGIVNCSTLAE